MTTHKRGRRKNPINKLQLEAVRDELVAAYDNVGTWGAVAAHYGISKAAAHRIANDNTYRPSQGTIDKVLIKDRPAPVMFELSACPDCRKAPHTGRCNGKPVAAVVTLAPGETARITNGTKRQRKAYWRPCLSPEVGEVVKERGIDVQRIMERYITDNYLW